MKYTNILEKLQYLFSAVTNSYVYLSFIIIVTLIFVLYMLKKIDKKKHILFLIISYIALFIIEVIFNYKELSRVFDSLMTNLFTNIYFPSTYSYLFVLIIVNISFLISSLNVKIQGIYRKINMVIFLIMQFILVLIMDIISKNNIDIFSKKSLFTNTKLVMMLELSINVFIVWLMLLLVVYIVNILTEKALIKQEEKVLSVKEISMPDTNINIEIDNENIKEEFDKANMSIGTPREEQAIYNNNIIEKKEFNFNDLIKESNSIVEEPIINENTQPVINTIIEPIDNIDITTEEERLEKEEPLNIVDMLLNNQIPVLQNEVKVDIKETIKESKSKDTYTLNDYKTFNKMLKEIRLYNLGSIVSIDKTLELRLLDKFSNDEYNLFKTMLKSYSN